MTSVALGLVLAVGACGKSGTPDATPTARVPDRSPTTAVDTDTSPATTVPGEEDFTAILRDLLARRDEAYEKNDVSILDSIYSPQCACLARARAVIEQRKAEGVRTAGERQIVHSVTVIDRPTDTYVVLRAITEQGPNQLIRGDGSVVRAGETEPPTAYLVAMTRERSGWVVASVQVDPASDGAP